MNLTLTLFLPGAVQSGHDGLKSAALKPKIVASAVQQSSLEIINDKMRVDKDYMSKYP